MSEWQGAPILRPTDTRRWTAPADGTYLLVVDTSLRDTDSTVEIAIS